MNWMCFFQVPSGRDHLVERTMRSFDYIYTHYLEEADWFVKADDDTYVIMENLRYFISAHHPDQPAYFGHHFKAVVSQGYMSGGAGYVISREALRRFGSRSADLCREDGGAEDVEFGKCLEKLQVPPKDSRDKLGRSRFHCFNPVTHLHGDYPDWYYSYDKYLTSQVRLHCITCNKIQFLFLLFQHFKNIFFYESFCKNAMFQVLLFWPIIILSVAHIFLSN